MICYTDKECCSQLRILRAASTHYPVLRSFLSVYDAINSHKATLSLDRELVTFDTGTDGIYRCPVSDLEPASDTSEVKFADPVPGLELQLQTKYVKIIALYQNAVHDYAQHPCSKAV